MLNTSQSMGPGRCMFLSHLLELLRGRFSEDVSGATSHAVSPSTSAQGTAQYRDGAVFTFPRSFPCS